MEMKQRKLWIRRKEKGHVLEGRTITGSLLIWTIPTDLEPLILHLINSSFFTQEKALKIVGKLQKIGIVINKEEING